MAKIKMKMFKPEAMIRVYIMRTNMKPNHYVIQKTFSDKKNLFYRIKNLNHLTKTINEIKTISDSYSTLSDKFNPFYTTTTFFKPMTTFFGKKKIICEEALFEKL